jgi:hypothetical protein
MIFNLQPRQFLLLYNCIKAQESEYRHVDEEAVYVSVKEALEGAIIGAFENLEMRGLATGFDKWIKSETNKIEDLQTELTKIKETIPQEVLVSKFKPLKKDAPVKIGRAKKNK